MHITKCLREYSCARFKIAALCNAFMHKKAYITMFSDMCN
jgi:hypothetical protein